MSVHVLPLTRRTFFSKQSECRTLHSSKNCFKSPVWSKILLCYGHPTSMSAPFQTRMRHNNAMYAASLESRCACASQTFKKKQQKLGNALGSMSKSRTDHADTSSD